MFVGVSTNNHTNIALPLFEILIESAEARAGIWCMSRFDSFIATIRVIKQDI